MLGKPPKKEPKRDNKMTLEPIEEEEYETEEILKDDGDDFVYINVYDDDNNIVKQQKRPMTKEEKERVKPKPKITKPMKKEIVKELNKNAKQEIGRTLTNEELEELIKKILNVGDFKGVKPLKLGKRY
jgi:hypothetical protein